jgi:hypothetical protein
MLMHAQPVEPVPDAEWLNCAGKLLTKLCRTLGRRRFVFALTADECLSRLGELEAAPGGQRAAAEVLGPSLTTMRAWKRRRRMSVPSRRLIWLVWALCLHPETIQDLTDLVTWGKLRPSC